MPRGTPVWAELATEQHGVLARRQLLALGLSEARARWPVDAGRWRTLFPGVYITHAGPITGLARTWAGVLYAGPGAHASHRTALWLGGVLDEQPAVTHVTVPGTRRVRAQPGLVIHGSRHLTQRRHPVALPPRTTLEDAVLDSIELTSSAEAVLATVFSATQRRRTTPSRLRAVLAGRPRHRWRALLLEVLDDVADGVASPLERRYARSVERAHGLPRGVRNTPDRTGGSISRYRDVRYPAHGLVVELDGRAAHPEEGRFRDFRRDNEVVAAGAVVLRYGWPDVTSRTCAVAGQLAGVLRARGWAGRPTACGPACSLPQP